MVPASKSDSAASNRSRRAATSPGFACARYRISSSPCACARSGSASAAATETNRSRVRSRNSCVAARLNVTSSNSEISTPASATNRTASPTMAYVLPVPALASSTVVPTGNGPVSWNPSPGSPSTASVFEPAEPSADPDNSAAAQRPSPIDRGRSASASVPPAAGNGSANPGRSRAAAPNRSGASSASSRPGPVISPARPLPSRAAAGLPTASPCGSGCPRPLPAFTPPASSRADRSAAPPLSGATSSTRLKRSAPSSPAGVRAARDSPPAASPLRRARVAGRTSRSGSAIENRSSVIRAFRFRGRTAGAG